MVAVKQHLGIKIKNPNPNHIAVASRGAKQLAIMNAMSAGPGTGPQGRGGIMSVVNRVHDAIAEGGEG